MRNFTNRAFLESSALGFFAAFGLLTSGGCGPDYPNCDNDDGCHSGEVCVNGQCQQCRDNSDCPAGQSCASGACEPIAGYCTATSDCPDGQECRQNRCSGPVTSTTDTNSAQGPCALQTVYFGFDQDLLDTASRGAIQQNAQCIQEKLVSSVHVTGHADPRGTEEYNLALGDRRARAVADYLRTVGAADVTHSSMGEEMAQGSDDSSWRRDRRAEFVER